MYRKKHNVHRALYYPQFQASTEALGPYLLWTKGGCCMVTLGGIAAKVAMKSSTCVAGDTM